MMTCIGCSKQIGGKSLHQVDAKDINGTPRAQQAIKTLTVQIKEMVVKASGAYKNCKPCSGLSSHHKHHEYAESETASPYDRLHGSYHHMGGLNSTPRQWGKEMEARLKGLSSSEGTPPSMSSRTEIVSLMDEEEPKEWVAQVEPGVLITFISIQEGGNDLKRIRFCREMFNKWQAQRWWAENYDKVIELYNVQRFNRQAVPNTQRVEDEKPNIETVEDRPVTPPVSKEHLPRDFESPKETGYSSSDSLDHHSMQSHNHHDSNPASTPKLSNISCSKAETCSLDASVRTSSSREADHSEEVSISNASDMETEWVEQDEPGVYITIRSLPSGVKELRRVRFSREKFGEMHARLWWEENRVRIHEQYL